MEVSMGSNMIRNTNGVIKVEGKDQMLLEIVQDNQLLLTMDIYDPKGLQTAKVIRNNFTLDQKSRYQLFAKRTSLMLIEKEHNSVVFEASIVDIGRLEIVQGTFYSWKAHPVEITTRYWRAMGITVSGMTFDCHGGAIIIG